jgi:hypothetical protein
MSAARSMVGMLLLFPLFLLRWVLFSAPRAVVGILLVFLLSISSFPVAQSRSDARLHLASPQQGEAIVQAAWELRRGLNPKPDCSHFIQAVYAKAGFVYDYATTREIYTGVDGFRRVQHPQPGDLVVWQGHMGIVIDPSEHSFYSSVLSGFAIENYQSHYWQARVGYPRFYRFVVSQPQPAPRTTTTTLLAGATPAHPGSKQPLARPVSTEKPALAVAQPVSSQKPDLAVARPVSSQKPAVTATVADSREGAGRQLRPVSSQKPAVMAMTTVAASHTAASPRPAQIVAKVEPAARMKVQVEAEAEAEAGKTVTPDTAIHSEVFVTSQAIPSRREVLAAIIRAADDNGEHLLRGRLLEWQPSVGVVDDFRLVSLDVQGNSGLAEVEVKQIAVFRYGKPISSRSVSTRRVILSRQQQGWILVTPQELLYLNHHQAAVALTDQLATLSKAPADQLQARKTAQILHELLAAGANTGGVD